MKGKRATGRVWVLACGSAALALACSSASSDNGGVAASAGTSSSLAGASVTSSGGTSSAGTSTGGTTSNGSGGPSTGSSGAAASGQAGNAGSLGATGGSAAAGSGAGGASGSSNAAGAGGTGANASGGAAAGGQPGLAPLEPASGALLGQYYGDGSIAQTAARLGRTLPVHLVYWAFGDNWTQGATAQDLAAGRIPLVNWEPDGTNFDDIVSGSFDSTIMARASDSKKLGKPFFLDFAAEMNISSEPTEANPTTYVAAWRHIHDLFSAAGATNVVWAWCPNVTDADNSNKTTLDYYPGDSYVDWTGVDGYNWGDNRWQSFSDVFKKIYPLLASKNKPILIGEMSSSETGGDKAAWISSMLPTLSRDFPLIKGVMWFDVNKERDWRINSSAASLAAFIAMAGDPYFNH